MLESMGLDNTKEVKQLKDSRIINNKKDENLQSAGLHRRKVRF